MKNAIQLSVPQVCHESWSAMTATDRGAFCQSCQKEVIDFSAMTDRELIEYLSKHTASCGRFRGDQLDVELAIAKPDNGIFGWRALLLSVLPLLAYKNAVASLPVKAPTDQSPIVNKKPAIDTAMACLPDHIIVTGKVLDERGEGVISAAITILDANGKSTHSGVVTDFDGNFSMNIATDTLRSRHLRVSYVGYKSDSITLTNDPVQNYTVKLNPAQQFYGGVVVITYKHPRAHKIKSFFRNIFHLSYRHK